MNCLECCCIWEIRRQNSKFILAYQSPPTSVELKSRAGVPLIFRFADTRLALQRCSDLDRTQHLSPSPLPRQPPFFPLDPWNDDENPLRNQLHHHRELRPFLHLGRHGEHHHLHRHRSRLTRRSGRIRRRISSCSHRAERMSELR